jgi:hypothetical protein
MPPIMDLLQTLEYALRPLPVGRKSSIPSIRIISDGKSDLFWQVVDGKILQSQECY